MQEAQLGLLSSADGTQPCLLPASVACLACRDSAEHSGTLPMRPPYGMPAVLGNQVGSSTAILKALFSLAPYRCWMVGGGHCLVWHVSEDCGRKLSGLRPKL